METHSIADIPSSIASPVPSYRSNVSENEQFPLWAREVTTALQNRQRVSRASSVISTRTKISTNTAREDARSIDLNIDGSYFRINRDGSRITTGEFRDNLPPYSEHFEADGSNGGYGASEKNQDQRDDQSVTTETADQTSESCSDFLFPRSQHSSYADSAGRVRRLDSSLRAATDNDLSRNLSFTVGREAISVTKNRAVSQSDVPTSASTLRRCNGIRLPTLVTKLAEDQQFQSAGSRQSTPDSTSPDYTYPRSADPTLGNDNHSFAQRSQSPTFIGRNAPGISPSPLMMPSSSDDQATPIAHSPARHEEGYTDTDPPPLMESENDISVHYTRLIRTIDRDNRKALHERDKEMAKLRERLNEQDMVYRQQLRAREFIIDDLRSRIAHLETTTEATVERACNSVEDLWEGRWKDKDFHLMERMRRMESDLQTKVEKAVAERDKVWAKGWATKYKQLIERLDAADQISQHDIDKFDADPPIFVRLEGKRRYMDV
jgi:hypothetical protein